MVFLKKYFGPILLLTVLLAFGAFKLFQAKELNRLSKDPQPGDIYLFEADLKYSPYLLDFSLSDSLYFFSHPFDFSKAMPSLEQIMEDSFHNNIHYIYGQEEIERLIRENKITKIYR